MTVVDPRLAKFATAIAEAYTAVTEDPAHTDAFFNNHAPMQLTLTTCDGIAVRFWADGIEFYPHEKEES